VQDIIVFQICAIACACVCVSEDKEGESVHRNLSNPDKERDQQQHHISEYHPILEAELPSLCCEGLLAARA
jgi:hypothetical protein